MTGKDVIGDFADVFKATLDMNVIGIIFICKNVSCYLNFPVEWQMLIIH